MDARRLKSKKFFGFVCVLLVTVILLMLKTSAKMAISQTPYLPTTDNEHFTSKEEPVMFSDVYQQRIKRVQQVCLEKNLSTNYTLKKKMYQAKKYRIAFDIVPKVGSTTFLAIINILNDRESEAIFRKSRKKMHLQSHEIHVNKVFDVETIRKYTVLVPSRDPYTRLYSSFIDKVYIFNSMNLVYSVLKHAGVKRDISASRKYNATFQMFIDYALDDSVSYHVMGNHYKPIFNSIRRSWLCSLRHFIVIKQETLSADLEYALQAVKVDNYKMEAIHSALYSRRAEMSIAGIVKTVMQKLHGILHSMGQWNQKTNRFKASVFVLSRLWSSFQIQGYIKAKSNFPFDQFSSKRSVFDVDFVLTLFLTEMKQNPIAHSESKQQRHRAVMAAYGNIKEDTVKKIQEVYKLDFQAFGYDSSLPN